VTDDRTPADRTPADQRAGDEPGAAQPGAGASDAQPAAGTGGGDAQPGAAEAAGDAPAADAAAIEAPDTSAEPADAPASAPTTPSPTPATPAAPTGPGAAPRPGHPAPALGGPGGWAIAALVVGVAAFLLGLVPVVGLVAALVGVALGVVALVRRRARSGLGLGVTGLVLSGLAAATNVAVVAVLVVATPIAARLVDEAASTWYDRGQPAYVDDAGTDAAGDVTTSCWTFRLPADTWAIGLDSDDATCRASLEVDDGSPSWIDVVTVPAATAATLVPAAGDDPVAAVEALRTSWLPAVGTVVGDPEQVELDGRPAALVRLATGTDLSAPAAVVVAWSPADASGASALTLVTVSQDGDGYEVDADTGTDTGWDDDAAWAADVAASRAAATERVLDSLLTTWDWTDR